jgi:hypothetical protein
LHHILHGNIEIPEHFELPFKSYIFITKNFSILYHRNLRLLPKNPVHPVNTINGMV